MPTQHIATLLGATCRVRLATVLRHVATCWVLLAQIWNWSKLTQQHPTCRNTSQHGGQTHATCCVQQCCDMLRWHVAIVWLGLNNTAYRVHALQKQVRGKKVRDTESKENDICTNVAKLENPSWACHRIFKDPPIVPYKRCRSFRDTLLRTKLLKQLLNGDRRCVGLSLTHCYPPTGTNLALTNSVAHRENRSSVHRSYWKRNSITFDWFINFTDKIDEGQLGLNENYQNTVPSSISLVINSYIRTFLQFSKLFEHVCDEFPKIGRASQGRIQHFQLLARKKLQNSRRLQMLAVVAHLLEAKRY